MAREQTTGRTRTRAEKAHATRTRMLDAARELFAEHGYTATKIESIAKRADVAVQTVYFVFGNKRTILKELLDIAVAGDLEPVPTLERTWVREAVTARDPHEQLRIQIEAARHIYERVAPVLEIVRQAAAADPEAATLWRTNGEQRLTVQTQLIAALAGKGALREDLTLGQAADIAFALAGPELYQLLVAERGWEPERWQAFVIDALSHELLADPHSIPPPSASY